MAQNKIPVETALDALNDVAAHFKPTLNGHGETAFYQSLVEKVNKFSGEAWTYRYLLSVRNGTIAPSQKFARAIIDLAGSLDSNLPDILVRAESLTLYAAPGAIHAGAYVMGESIICADPTYRMLFVPSHPRRKYCPACRPPKGKGA